MVSEDASAGASDMSDVDVKLEENAYSTLSFMEFLCASITLSDMEDVFVWTRRLKIRLLLAPDIESSDTMEEEEAFAQRLRFTHQLLSAQSIPESREEFVFVTKSSMLLRCGTLHAEAVAASLKSKLSSREYQISNLHPASQI